MREEVHDLLHKPVIASASRSHFDHVGTHHEFEERLIHSAEAATMAEAGRALILRVAAYGEAGVRAVEEAGYLCPRMVNFSPPCPMPGSIRTAEQEAVGRRHLDERAGPRSTGLEQQYSVARVFAQAVGQHATGGTATDDHVVERVRH